MSYDHFTLYYSTIVYSLKIMSNNNNSNNNTSKENTMHNAIYGNDIKEFFYIDTSSHKILKGKVIKTT